MPISLFLGRPTVAWLEARWRGRQGDRKGVRSIRLAKGAVELNSGLAILGGEAQGGRTTQGPDIE